jgi:lipid-binding SYLF domain-containing protein
MTSPPIDRRRVLISAAGLVTVGGALGAAGSAAAASAAEITANARAVLQKLYAVNTKARQLGHRALAELVFPAIGKGGFLVAAESGNGALLMHGRAAGFYNISAASFGFQAGLQKLSYVLFFITPSALDYLKKSDGWAVGSGPSLVLVDQGFAKNFDTTTLTQDVYAFAFNQKGLMGGIALKGSKITPIHPGP